MQAGVSATWALYTRRQAFGVLHVVMERQRKLFDLLVEPVLIWRLASSFFFEVILQLLAHLFGLCAESLVDTGANVQDLSAGETALIKPVCILTDLHGPMQPSQNE